MQNLLRHIDGVRDSCLILGNKLIERGEKDLGRKLIANGFIHDNSKFYGIEWLYLNEQTRQEDPEKFKLALYEHWSKNPHHPEYWDSIEMMPRLYLGEFAADLKARSSEFGTDLKEWIKTKATKKYKFSSKGKVYKEINEFIKLLLEKSFS